MSNEKNENPAETTTGAGKSGGATPMSVSEHTYRFTSVPVGCTDWKVNETIDIYVSNPPPQTLILNDGDMCDGAEATLVS